MIPHVFRGNPPEQDHWTHHQYIRQSHLQHTQTFLLGNHLSQPVEYPSNGRAFPELVAQEISLSLGLIGLCDVLGVLLNDSSPIQPLSLSPQVGIFRVVVYF